ncbi:ATP-binding protein [Streptomyces cylindrosporus]|uniref:ATP-binding protein n=1 Tax=Streptomyces cylindrosporus TaxID=2927583 RepID=A0ABS9Y0D1_9ACTN|nr:ATP-binding protein [Streptomyces cylindrosporus]MCI3270639.1 ATP-binding protein [Streptomyces cylindrosporus]
MRDRDAQPIGGIARRLAAILTARGIDPAAPITDPVEPIPALQAAQARIPARYQAAVADHPAVTAWVRAIAEAGRPGPEGAPGIAQGRSLLIVGTTGTGKTHQAYGAIRSLLIAGVRLRWKATTAADLYAELRPRPGHDGERELMDLARCPLLIIDDLGAAKNSEWTEEITMRLINRRYNEMLPTLITTNLGMVDLRQHIGDRVASRLTEMSDKVILDGPDRRRALAAERRRIAAA